MDEKIKDGGPAFPTTEPIEFIEAPGYAPAPSRYGTVGGMTLRDYFAAAALTGIMNSGMMVSASLRTKDCAKLAYEHADAMLKARGQ